MRRRWLWIVVAVAVIVLGAAVLTRGIGFTSRAEPSSLEAALMRAARRWGTPADVRSQTNPVPATKEVLKEAMAHWADHCSGCHDNNGSGGTSLGRSLYPPAPDMREAATQSLSDGELFYIIERGIPLTGMPAWGNGTEEGRRQSWELVRFIRHLPQLTANDIEDMEKMNPKSPVRLEQDRQIEDFLKGGR